MAEAPKPWADYGAVWRELWPQLRHLPGDVAEFGCYQGGTARQLAEITQRYVWAFDTFDGIPAEDYDAKIDVDEPGKFQSGARCPLDLFRDCPLVMPVQGRFAVTLPAMDALVRVQFCLVYVDCDLYASAKQVLDWLPKRLVPGAQIIFDDFVTHSGIRLAVKEFVATNMGCLGEFAQAGEIGMRIEWRGRCGCGQ